jgi:hypothetical protein
LARHTLYISIVLTITTPTILTAVEDQRRNEQLKIEEMIKLSQIYNQKPSSKGSPRAARLARNRYRNQSEPIYPKTIFPEVLATKRMSRFFGGIPRGS